jgi:hypothetical protein
VGHGAVGVERLGHRTSTLVLFSIIVDAIRIPLRI